ncbi:MAG: hypothetical protein QOJ52_775, partial [Acidimicrobiaceae bacterium]|nr:hypothetical protein [Acidimicrobiaceae bacterium]
MCDSNRSCRTADRYWAGPSGSRPAARCVERAWRRHRALRCDRRWAGRQSGRDSPHPGRLQFFLAPLATDSRLPCDLRCLLPHPGRRRPARSPGAPGWYCDLRQRRRRRHSDGRPGYQNRDHRSRPTGSPHRCVQHRGHRSRRTNTRAVDHHYQCRLGHHLGRCSSRHFDHRSQGANIHRADRRLRYHLAQHPGRCSSRRSQGANNRRCGLRHLGHRCRPRSTRRTLRFRFGPGSSVLNSHRSDRIEDLCRRHPRYDCPDQYSASPNLSGGHSHHHPAGHSTTSLIRPRFGYHYPLDLTMAVLSLRIENDRSPPSRRNPHHLPAPHSMGVRTHRRCQPRRHFPAFRSTGVRTHRRGQPRRHRSAPRHQSETDPSLFPPAPQYPAGPATAQRRGGSPKLDVPLHRVGLIRDGPYCSSDTPPTDRSHAVGSHPRRSFV